MEKTLNKTRTPSRCREWERQRRNKFNDAISRLGELVKQLNKSDDETDTKESNSTQYPKIEIIEKAIIYLTNYAQEKIQLKAEILALQVKLDKKTATKDASTQVFLKVSRKTKKKSVKLIMVNELKQNVPETKTTNCNSIQINETTKTNTISPKCRQKILPKLLPRSNFNKKGPENTIVVLPASQYIFPQRPLLLPTVPPAFVLVDPLMQSLNKTLPVVTRNGSDVTKTTMVNILPISAYSRPLSASKSKIKQKIEFDKTVKKKCKMISRTSVGSAGLINTKPPDDKLKVSQITDNEKQNVNRSSKVEIPVHITLDKRKTIVQKHVSSDSKIQSLDLKDNTTKQIEISKTESSVAEKISSLPINANAIERDTNLKKDETKKVESDLEKESASIDRDKNCKLPNLLESTLNENNVDGGNARLELAEELLAASPTAAFLMSFPLVSGNRIDSPTEETNSAINSSKVHHERRIEVTSQAENCYMKCNDSNVMKSKESNKNQTSLTQKHCNQEKSLENPTSKQLDMKIPNPSTGHSSSDNPFLNLSLPSFMQTNCTLTDTLNIDFECNLNKPITSQATTYVSSNNLFYKNDPFTVKNTIYSTSSMPTSHEYSNIGLYPCAMEKYSSKGKSDYANVEDSLMKIGNSRLTYDIDLGWSQKGLDFVSCSNTASFNKENTATYSTAYNPFNPDFHVPFVSNSSKKDVTDKTVNTSFNDNITNFFSQSTNLWTEDIPFYSANTLSKVTVAKENNFPPRDNNDNTNLKNETGKSYITKLNTLNEIDNRLKTSNVIDSTEAHGNDKFTKKSSNKMHINWMTSEFRTMQNNFNSTNTTTKDSVKALYPNLDYSNKKQDHSDSNYFPLPIHNFSTQNNHDEFQVWPSTKPLGTTEVTMEPPPLNLPTLVGDLALGPHDKKKANDIISKCLPANDSQSCNNFLSVAQLMNRSSDNLPSRYNGTESVLKTVPLKHNLQGITESVRKSYVPRIENSTTQPCYIYNENKSINSYESLNQFPQSKAKSNKSEKSNKVYKTSYSAEALLRGGTCTQKIQDNTNVKFTMPLQKYTDFGMQDNSIAQVSHYPPIVDYSDSSYASQQLSGTTLYNSSNNTISNTFYSNIMQSSSNLGPPNYSSGTFSNDYVDYQNSEFNYPNHRYDDLKMRTNNSLASFQQDKVPLNYKNSRRESATKHKLECSKKETSKKNHNKKSRLNEEDWNDSNILTWQNRTAVKKHSNALAEPSYTSFTGNQMTPQYQPDYFSGHLMPPTANQNERTLSSFPGTTRANFNLSTIFPEITMKVQ